MDISGVVGLVVLVVGVILFIPVLLGGVFVIVVVANRSEPDPTGRRARGVYAYATSFVTLFVAIFASTGLVASLAELIGSHHNNGSKQLFGIVSSATQSAHPIGDAAARGAVLSIIIALVAGAMYSRHRGIGDGFAAGTTSLDPVGRVRASYVAAVAFVCVVLTVVATIVVWYDVFRLIAPGVFAPGLRDGRASVLRSLLPALWLGLVAAGARRGHLDVREAPPPVAEPVA
jgi:hypothetical protein